MPTPTYDLIASNVLTSSASSVTFSSIPATYRDLVLVIDAKAVTTKDIFVRLNSDTGSNYSQVYMFGNGSTAGSGTNSGTSMYLTAQYATSTGASLSITQFLDYSATDKHKTVLSRGGETSQGVDAWATRWANTAAINTILIGLGANNFASGSSFYLYGIVS